MSGMNADTGRKTWLTPRWILDSLGEFDLDPCCPNKMPWKTAERMICRPEDGLSVDWHGRVWLNPPYGRDSIPFLEKMAEHGSGIALLFGRTDTSAWQNLIFPNCRSVMFMSGRMRFLNPDGSLGGRANAPSALVAYSYYDHKMLKRSGIKGTIMEVS